MKLFKRLLFPILLIIGLVVFASRLTDLEQLIILVKQGVWYYIAIALLLSFAIVYFQAELVRSLYAYLSIDEPLIHAISIIVATNFANFILPSIGFSGITLFVNDARTRNISTSKSLTVSLLYYLYYFLTFTLILIFGLTYLLLTGRLSVYQTLTSIIFFIILGCFTTFLWNTAHSAKRSMTLLTLLVSFANTPYRWLKNRNLIGSTKINELAQGMFENLVFLRNKSAALALPITYSIAIHISSMLLVGYLFAAFGYQVQLITIIIGFSMAILFSLVSITPGGVGFVEGIMVLTFKSLGVPIEIALVVTVIYRGLTFWLPFIFGIIALRKLHLSHMQTLESK